jgi:iron complex transport system ATP-binding protein
MSLVVEHLQVSRAERKVLRDITFSVERGTFLVIVGPNGAGKTTLAKAIAGLLPFKGSISWEGKKLSAMSTTERARTLAFLPQGHVVHWPIAAREVVAIGRMPFGSTLTSRTTEDETAIVNALTTVQAEAFAERPITELSGGERARIMLARALAVGAPILIADEPVASLDPEHQISVMKTLADKAKSGNLVIAVSHDLVLAARYADHVLVLRDGTLAASGAPEEALNVQVLRDVFNVEAKTFENGSRTVNVPWRIAGSRVQ